MKLKIIFGLYLFIICTIISCDSPESDKYAKMLQIHQTKMSQVFPGYYLNLVQQKARDKIKLSISLENIGQDTVCNFSYDKNYDIALYTLSKSFKSSLQSSLHEDFRENSRELGIPFYINGTNLIGISRRVYIKDSDYIGPANIFISFGGSELESTKKNDTIVDYNFSCKNLSIRYEINGPQQIFVNANDGDKPLEVMLLKRQRKLFLIFITPKKDLHFLNKSIGLSIFK
jgi:hypothetical protein